MALPVRIGPHHGISALNGLFPQTRTRPNNLIPPATTNTESSYYPRPPATRHRTRLEPALSMVETLLDAQMGLRKRLPQFIDDEEILEIHLHPDDFLYELPKHAFYESITVPYGRLSDGRAVLQQVGATGCGAACTAMMLLDHGRHPDICRVVHCDKTHDDSVLVSELEEAGLNVHLSKIFYPWTEQDGTELESLLTRSGPGILGVIGLQGEIGGHFIILDSLSIEQNTATIREPFHGWNITITAESILKRACGRFIYLEP